MSVHCRDGIWNVIYTDLAGKRTQKSFGRGEEAKKLAYECDMHIKERKQAHKEALRNSEIMVSTGMELRTPEPKNEIAPQEDKPAITFGQLVAEFLAHSQVNGSSDDHRKSISLVAEKLYFPHFGKDKLITSISYADILEFMSKIENENSRNGRKRSTITINQYGNYLRAFFRYAVDLGYLDKNPMSRWKPKKIPPKQVKLTVEDLQKIMAHAAPHLKWALEVEYHLGLRSGLSELLSLKWEDIDFDAREVHVYASKTKTYRTIPINDEKFLEALRERRKMAVTPYVVEYEGKPVMSLKRSFNTAVKLANLPYPVRMYDVRHLFATMLIGNGATIGAVSALLGHSKTSTTLNVYYHATEAEIINAVDKLPSLQAI